MHEFPATPDNAETFTCRSRTTAGAAWLCVGGVLDSSSVGRLHSLLAEQPPRAPVVLDLRRVTHVDGVGVRAIIHASLSARADRVSFLRIGGPRIGEGLFALAGGYDLPPTASPSSASLPATVRPLHGPPDDPDLSPCA